MNWEKLLENKSLQEKRVSLKEVESVLEKACNCVKAAKLLLKGGVNESVFKEAYDAMLLAGRALMFFQGLKPRSVGSHAITIEFCELYLGEDFKTLILKFKKMKQKRNYLIYGIGLAVSKTEAENSLKAAEEFVEKISKLIKQKNLQKKLIQ